jgi:chromosome segregation ATPase
LELKQVPVLQEQLNQSDRKIKSLELRLSTKVQENKKLHQDFEAKRCRDIEAAKNACEAEAEKQLDDALSKEHQEFGEQVLQGLQELSLPSDVLKEQFSQACVENFPECSLNDLFGILQQLIDHIYTNHGEQILSVERELKNKAIEVQELDTVNQSLSTQLKDSTLSVNRLKASSDSFQVKLDATLLHLAEKDIQVQSSCSRATELEKTLAQKTQRYDETVTELRSEVQRVCHENQDIAKRLVEKQKESVLLTNQIIESKQEFTVALDERSNLIKFQEEQIAIKDACISQLTASIQQLDQSLCEANADLRQKLAIINLLQVSSQEQEAELEASRQQVLEMEAQAKNKDATINSLKEHVLMLGAQLSTTDVETKNLQMGNQNLETQLTQANTRLSDLVCQVNALSHNSVTIQGKLDVATQEYDAVTHTLAEKVALVAQLENALNDANQSLVQMQANLKEKDDNIIALKSLLDARDAMAKPHEPKGNHPLFGMMNLRGCAWNWHIHCLVNKYFSPWTIHFA